MRWPSTRAVMSADDPGVKPTMIRTGRAGYSSAPMRTARRSASAASAACNVHRSAHDVFLRNFWLLAQAGGLARPSSHRLISRSMKRAKSSGRAADQVDTQRARSPCSPPSALRASLPARSILSITSLDVPAGAIRPNHKPVVVARAGPLRSWSGGRARCAVRFASVEARRDELAVANVRQHGRGRREQHLDAAGKQVGRPTAGCRGRARAPS